MRHALHGGLHATAAVLCGTVLPPFYHDLGFGLSRVPPDPAGLLSEGGAVMKLHKEGSLTLLTPGFKRVYLWEY